MYILRIIDIDEFLLLIIHYCVLELFVNIKSNDNCNNRKFVLL